MIFDWRTFKIICDIFNNKLYKSNWKLSWAIAISWDPLVISLWLLCEIFMLILLLVKSTLIDNKIICIVFIIVSPHFWCCVRGQLWSTLNFFLHCRPTLPVLTVGLVAWDFFYLKNMRLTSSYLYSTGKM